MIPDTELHQLILDPMLPLPRGLRKRDVQRVQDLRAAYATVFAQRARGQSVKDPGEAARLLIPLLAGAQTERFVALALNTRSCVINEPCVVSHGDVDGTDAGPRLVFRAALKAGATSVLVAHNHPTGDPNPSAADRAVTTRLVQCGTMLDITLADHLIIGHGGAYISLRREYPEIWRGASS